MKHKEHLSRKSFLIKAAVVAGGIFAPSFLNKFFNNPLKKYRNPVLLNAAQPADGRLVVITGPDIKKQTIEKMAMKALDQFGGMKSLIRKGMNVVIKPNIAWNSPPENAANTNPDLVEIVARFCKEAGGRVTIFDRTCSSARLSYKRSGIEDAAKRAGVNIEFIDERKFINVKVPNALNSEILSIYKPILDADFVINMPIAKHHSSSRLTISMKNLLGVIGGNRGSLHWNLHENIVDFTKAIKCDLIICDCLRILTNHGPNSGTPEDVKETRTLIIGRNPVTVDAYASTFFVKSPSEIKYLALAYREKMGEINPGKMNILKLTV
ncbi:MAG: DUF362 domain-containing protein [Spirochaetes bacterium]|nr:DUF362 domain-containing protein [Spirochaetota bacterium]